MPRPSLTVPVLHGTLTSYQRRCRCDDCRDVAAAATRTRPPISGERCAVNCWCTRDTILVLVEHVNAGMTGVCGRPDCQPPKAA
jgi:hypothetical protein